MASFNQEVEDEFLKFQQASGQLSDTSGGWIIGDHDYQPSREELDFLNQSGLNEDPDELPYCACCFGGQCVNPDDVGLQHKDDFDSAVENALDALDLDSSSPSQSMHNLSELRGDFGYAESPKSGYSSAIGARAPLVANRQHSQPPRQPPHRQQQQQQSSSAAAVGGNLSLPASPPAARSSELRATASEFVPSWLAQPAAVPADPVPSGGHPARFNRVCRWKEACTKPDCLFQHPQPFASSEGHAGQGYR